MGGSLSEPLLLIDSSTFVDRLYTDPAFRLSQPFLKRIPHLQNTLAGFQHVDDVLLISPTICTQCMLDILTLAFPSDYSFGLEAEGQALDFLHARIVIDPKGPGKFGIRVVPKLATLHTLSSLTPKTSRALVYLDDVTTPRAMLLKFLIPHLHTFNFCFSGESAFSLEYLAVLILETRFAGWSGRAISRSMLSIGGRHDSAFFSQVRSVAKRIRGDDGIWEELHDHLTRLRLSPTHVD